MFGNRSKCCYAILAILLCAVLSACGESPSSPAKKTLKLGCLPWSEPMMQWVKEALEPLGYKAEVIMFDANQLPAVALKDGNLDGIIANHRPWVETFNRENKCDLEMVKPYYFHSFFAIYSKKYTKLEQIPQNGQMAIPGDPTNLSRALLTLQSSGLIKLKPKTGAFYTLMDIQDNPKNIKFIETEVTQTVRSVDDVDAIIATAYYVGEVGKMDPRSFLFEDPQNKNFPLGLIVRRDDLESDWAKSAITALRTEKYRAKFNETFKGKYTLYE